MIQQQNGPANMLNKWMGTIVWFLVSNHLTHISLMNPTTANIMWSSALISSIQYDINEYESDWSLIWFNPIHIISLEELWKSPLNYCKLILLISVSTHNNIICIAAHIPSFSLFSWFAHIIFYNLIWCYWCSQSAEQVLMRWPIYYRPTITNCQT